MFDHVTIRASDRDASARFYRTVLGSIGIEPHRDDDALIGWDEFAVIATTPEHPPTQNLHIGFVSPSHELVDAFWQAGVDAGYESDGEPGPRAEYGDDYYGSFLLDPDGNSAEAVLHGDTRRGGNIDHLWIGVEDLESSARFYDQLARHLGLRWGSKSDQRRQFTGAWATFSLVSDGRPPTENLHLAFPARDRQTVDEFHAAAIKLGYADNGAPGERPQYAPGYYAAFVIDPSGINVESVYRG
jgi:catechol 2,3-dioxygenase-like lactoylglutathione lyase family enzyme